VYAMIRRILWAPFLGQVETMRQAGWLLMLGALAMGSAACDRSEGGTGMQVGYAEIEITPPTGTILGGYGVPGQRRVTTGVHDPLLAQAALFVNREGQAFLILSVDLAGYLWDFGDWGPGVKAVRQSIAQALAPVVRLQPEHVLVASSHSHGATDLAGFCQDIGQGPDKALLDEHLRRLTDVALAAARNLQEARLFFGATQLGGISARDRECSPVLDEEVGIVQARDGEGRVLVTIANFAKHPTIAGEANRLATADFVWGYREEMGKATGAPAIYLQGFEAAVHGKYSFSSGDDMWDRVYEIGSDLARAVLSVQDALVEATDHSIRHRAATFSCEGRDSFMVDAFTLLDMPKRFVTMTEETVTVDEIEVSWHQVGPAEFAVFPGEPSPEYSVMLKQRMISPFRFTVALGNDSIGYLIEPASLANDTTGQLSGYEVRMGLGPLAGPAAWTAMEGLGWFDGAWQDGE